MPQAANVKLDRVYNVLGETVKFLENSYKSAGNYSVTFNANGLSSGIYFYRIEAGSFYSNKKNDSLKITIYTKRLQRNMTNLVHIKNISKYTFQKILGMVHFI